MWRKNRSPSSENPICYGTDLNRNFDFHHGGKKILKAHQVCAKNYENLLIKQNNSTVLCFDKLLQMLVLQMIRVRKNTPGQKDFPSQKRWHCRILSKQSTI